MSSPAAEAVAALLRRMLNAPDPLVTEAELRARVPDLDLDRDLDRCRDVYLLLLAEKLVRCADEARGFHRWRPVTSDDWIRRDPVMTCWRKLVTDPWHGPMPIFLPGMFRILRDHEVIICEGPPLPPLPAPGAPI